MSESEYHRGRKNFGKILDEKSLPKKRLPNEDPKKYNVVKKLNENNINNDDSNIVNVSDAIKSINLDSSNKMNEDDNNSNNMSTINPWNTGGSSSFLSTSQDLIDNNNYYSIFDSNLTFGAMNNLLSHLISRNYIDNKVNSDNNTNIENKNDIIHKLKAADNAAMVKRQEVLDNKLKQLHNEYTICLEKK